VRVLSLSFTRDSEKVSTGGVNTLTVFKVYSTGGDSYSS
jgi:hypothetical protein